MRLPTLRTTARLLPLLLLGAVAVACTADTSDDDFEGSDSALNGGPTALTGPVVIGAGVAGARTVYELKQKGVTNITLIAPASADGTTPDTGLTNTMGLPNGGTVDVGASLFPDTYEVLEVGKNLGLDFKELDTNLAIVRNGHPVVIDQSNSLSLYKLFSPFELTPIAAIKTQLELIRLKLFGFNHRDGRRYAGESRTIEQYLEEFSGKLPAQYLSVIPEILGGQDPKTASAGFQQSLFMMTGKHVYTLPQMQELPLRMISASGAKVELARVTKVEQQAGGTTLIEGLRSSGQQVSWTTTAPVVVAATMPIAAKFVRGAGPEEHALLDAPMAIVNGINIELTPGWHRPAALNDCTYGGVPDVERGNGYVKGWGLDYRSPAGDERVVGLMLVRPAADPASISEAIHEATKYLPDLESHVKAAYPGTNPYHAPSLTPAFYKAVDTYWKWIGTQTNRKIILAGQSANQYGMDGASFSGRLAADAVLKKLPPKK